MLARKLTLILALTIALGAPSLSTAEVLTGHADGVPPLVQTFTWGIAPNALTGAVSYMSSTRLWVYGDRISWGPSGVNTDVYHAGPIDPTTVTDASVFAYSDPDFPVSSVGVGDCVFFRGDNGHYGAWVITAINGTIQTLTVDFDWYYQTDGTGNFESPLPTESSTWGAVKALYR